MSAPNALATATLLPLLAADIQGAMGSGDFLVIFDRAYVPAEGNYAAEYALIVPQGVDISFSGPGASVGSASQTNEFDIVLRRKWSSAVAGMDLALQKVADANAVIAALQTGPDFHGVAMLPLVTRVAFDDLDAPGERVYEVALTFSAVTEAGHH